LSQLGDPRKIAIDSCSRATERRVTVTEKQRVVEAVHGLPDDATVEDAIERLCFLVKVQKGVGELDRREGVPHEEAKRRIFGG
jgi:hypothetical protein